MGGTTVGEATAGFSTISILAVGVTLGAGVGVGGAVAGRVGKLAVSAEGRLQPTNIIPNKTAAKTAVIFNLFDHMTWNCNAKKNDNCSLKISNHQSLSSVKAAAIR